MPHPIPLTLAGRPVQDTWAEIEVKLGRRPPGAAIIAEADLLDIGAEISACSEWGVEPRILRWYHTSITFRLRKTDGTTATRQQGVLVKPDQLSALCAFISEHRARLYGELPFCQPS